MIKIVRNTGEDDGIWAGVQVLAGDSYTIPTESYAEWARDVGVLGDVIAGTLVMNDGSRDLSASEGIDLLKGTSPSEVVTQFEKRDKTLKLVHGEDTVDGSGNATILIKVPGTPGSSDGRWISSGIAFFDVHTAGDKVLGVYFTDEDDILGYGAGFVVGSYTDDEADSGQQGWAIPPNGFVKAEAIGGYGFAPAGFYVKVVGKKAGALPTGKFYVNLEWGRVE